MFKFCPECGVKSTAAGSKFCSECGFRYEAPGGLPPAAPAKMLDSSFQPPPPPPPMAMPVYSDIPQARVVSIVVPAAATGAEAQALYGQCLDTIRSAKGGNNEAGVRAFKDNCRAYGLGEMNAPAFHSSLVNELGGSTTSAFLPQLVRLIPDEGKRRALLEYDQQTLGGDRDSLFGAPASNNSISSRSSWESNPDTAQFSNSKVNPNAKPGMLNSRYADHPNCDICNVTFTVTNRRHQCRSCGLFVCNSCSPMKLLIPMGQQIPGAKGYSVSEPQRACIQCAPRLHPLQDELIQQYGSFQKDNEHKAAFRIHAPYSSNLEKECRNAADIIGNFFRNEWGADQDRRIPVTFLEKAQGLAIMTVLRVGFLVSGSAGTGLVVSRLPNGQWSAPSAIGTVGLSGGFEIGGELAEIMIILGSQGAVKVFEKPQVNVGRRPPPPRGLYAGISLTGTIIAARKDLNTKFYGREVEPELILNGTVEQPNAARPLYEALERAMQGVEEHKMQDARRSEIMGSCRSCGCPRFVPHTAQVWNKNCKTCKHIH
ncbi:hypothetical protein SPRG_16811 [Saprolegnia parasitica CBS 223.65]|uniref:FYVE-type domain-containing protein n=1 Tax=Saprolegnia parasitica (strain CBS 223.65) TaxID=695850 RepID=A0A067BTP4_SAPPC|nr:hypothetical protein SPRG_16811 [Saprolegnia parasitica CBS 223.65]KDO17646.1 hypothetical protein SPRG_16811 [Saprolegnia parasitica CBS 223.65]|eukprot:XP_012211646.1 hypothetical protein SPRG_16811 [Saprolegnia parasitica CBS 223.65]